MAILPRQQSILVNRIERIRNKKRVDKLKEVVRITESYTLSKEKKIKLGKRNCKCKPEHLNVKVGHGYCM